MAQVNAPYRPALVLVLIWGFLNLPTVITPGWANTSADSFVGEGRPISTASGGSRVEESQQLEPIQFNTPPDDFSGEGRPISRTTGGSRGVCTDQLVALVPGEGELDAEPGVCDTVAIAHPTLTLDETPTFWFYIPEQSVERSAEQSAEQSTSTTAEFVLLDEFEQPISIQRISLTAIPGVVGIRLNQPLTLNRSYRWVFTLLVNSHSPSLNPTVEGIVRRVSPDAALTAQLTAATPREQVAVYAENGIWQDALTRLATLRHANSAETTLAEDWLNLLNSVGLGAIAEASLTSCCSSEE